MTLQRFFFIIELADHKIFSFVTCILCDKSSVNRRYNAMLNNFNSNETGVMKNRTY